MKIRPCNRHMNKKVIVLNGNRLNVPLGPFPSNLPFRPLKYATGKHVARRRVPKGKTKQKINILSIALLLRAKDAQCSRCNIERHLALSSFIFDQDGQSTERGSEHGRQSSVPRLLRDRQRSSQ
jgi:hypothetical protein